MRDLLVTRVVCMGAIGLVCAVYAVLVLVTGKPDPMPFWIPGVIGVVAWFAIFTVALRKGTQVREAAFDEGYLSGDRRAQQIGFWVGLFLYPLFGVLMYAQVVAGPAAFAAMGTLMAAAYLLSTVWFDVEGRSWWA